MAEPLRRRATDGMGKSWLELGVKFGVPALIAIYLVYFQTQKIEVDLQNISAAMTAHASISESQADALTKLILINQQQCINSAITAKRNPQECLK